MTQTPERTHSPIYGKRIRAIRGFLGFVIKFCIGFVLVSPLLYAVMISIMPASDIAIYPPKFIPSYVTFEHFKAVLKSFPIFRYTCNSLLNCLIIIFFQVLTSCFAAYALVFFEFRGKKLLFGFILATMMIPGETTIIANFLSISAMKLNDTRIALALPYLASGMGIFLMRQSFLTVPKELKEAADLDGCGSMRFLFQILIPISKPSIAALSVYSFILIYNQYLWPLLVTNTDKMRTVQLGMSFLTQAEAGSLGDILAGAVLSLLIPTIGFVVCHKYLVKGLTAGAVKG